MTTNWYLIDSGGCAFDYNMALDEALMQSASRLAQPVLRFYGWTEPAASFGYSQSYEHIASVTPLRPLVRRPTGGGLVPHDADWTYSCAFPPGDPWYALKAVESYQRVHEWIRDAFGLLGIKTMLAPEAIKDVPGQCFIGAEKSDVLWRGRKIAGAAQRRNQQGLLIQGSVQPPPGSPARTDWQDAMLQAARDQFSVTWTRYEPDAQLAQLTESLRAEKYSQPGFNERR